jgi:hypothetical protein
VVIGERASLGMARHDRPLASGSRDDWQGQAGGSRQSRLRSSDCNAERRHDDRREQNEAAGPRPINLQILAATTRPKQLVMFGPLLGPVWGGREQTM